MSASDNLCAASCDLPVHDESGPLSPRAEIQRVIDRIALEHNVTPFDIVSPSRTRRIVKARDQAIYEVACRWPWLSLPKLGRIFGNRDHTTILHALNKLGAPPRRTMLRAHGVDARIEGLVMGRLVAALAAALDRGRA